MKEIKMKKKIKNMLKAYERSVKNHLSKEELEFAEMIPVNDLRIGRGIFHAYKAGQKAEREKHDWHNCDGCRWELKEPSQEIIDYYTDPTEWLPLQIDNLPKNIFDKGNYEYKWVREDGSENIVKIFLNKERFLAVMETVFYQVNEAGSTSAKLFYRPIQEEKAETESKETTQEEKMSLWWEVKENVWRKVDTFANIHVPATYIFNHEVENGRRLGEYPTWGVSEEWFKTHKSSITPPIDKGEKEVIFKTEGILRSMFVRQEPNMREIDVTVFIPGDKIIDDIDDISGGNKIDVIIYKGKES